MVYITKCVLEQLPELGPYKELRTGTSANLIEIFIDLQTAKLYNICKDKNFWDIFTCYRKGVGYYGNQIVYGAQKDLCRTISKYDPREKPGRCSFCDETIGKKPGPGRGAGQIKHK